MTTLIPWNDGPGNIVLTYAKGEGNQVVTVTSDTDCIDHDRSQRVTFVVGAGAITNEIVTASGNVIKTADDNTVNALSGGTGLDEVNTANGNSIVTSDGNNVFAHQNSMKVMVIVTQKAAEGRLVVTQNDHIIMTANNNAVTIR